MERTLVLIKPDAVQRGLVGEITQRFEKKGLKLVGMKMFTLEDALLKEHYGHLADKPFFPRITKFMKSSPVIAQCWEGLEAVSAVRILCGITLSREADAGSIRGDLAMSIQCNVVHASDSVETAQAEVARFFSKEDLFGYDKSEYMHIYSEDEITK
ncbi:MAG TPA: nucleoside-diphosphate kinase [Candidatus Peregrinibacteria bacterium]|nr:nucleoside-diphosphate kinase [Candidatus Peregrinibacteria bacterium]